jgi:hypothetical protein
MNLRRTWADLLDIARRFGIAAAVTESLCRLFVHLCDGRCHVVVLVTQAGTETAARAPSTDAPPRFLSAEEIRATASRDSELFDETFAAEALARGDECVACFDGARVVSTSWYTVRPCRLSNGLWATCDRRYVYNYKAHTLRAYRGKRLAGQRGAFVIRAFAQRGYDGIIAEIEIDNFSSLRNAARLGARRVGAFVAWRMFGRYRSVASRGCRSYGYVLSAMPPLPPSR